jgi:hypothetical protein
VNLNKGIIGLGFALRENSFFESLGKTRPDIPQIMSYHIDSTQKTGVYDFFVIIGSLDWCH